MSNDVTVFLSAELSAAERKNMLIRLYSTRKRIWKACRSREITPAELKYLQDLAEVRLPTAEVCAEDLKVWHKADQAKRVAKNDRIILRRAGKKAA